MNPTQDTSQEQHAAMEAAGAAFDESDDGGHDDDHDGSGPDDGDGDGDCPGCLVTFQTGGFYLLEPS